ncbi:MAG TPA: undecaprenyl-diphosphate phosphatase, partial [Phycisphaerae bacterium]|nr:undecaprenyl-diphosphate phosphatase [Phycisphaerae bacterium]
MTDFWRSIILGIVEGLTEFLPVSSTGHMILVEPLLGIRDGRMESSRIQFWKELFDIFIQTGAILAVVLYFWRPLWRLTFHSTARVWHEHILVKLFVAFLPAAIIGKLFGDWMKLMFAGACPTDLGPKSLGLCASVPFLEATVDFDALRASPTG